MMIRRTNGYTLIEILIVIVIISIVSTVALLTIGHNQHRRMEAVANQFTQMMTLAEEQAMLQPAVMGVAVYSHSFEFLTYQPTENGKAMHWVAVDNNALQKHSYSDDIQLTLTVAGSTSSDEDHDKASPQIVISTNGDITPFKLAIGQREEAPLYVVTGDADGTINSQSQT